MKMQATLGNPISIFIYTVAVFARRVRNWNALADCTRHCATARDRRRHCNGHSRYRNRDSLVCSDHKIDSFKTERVRIGRMNLPQIGGRPGIRVRGSGQPSHPSRATKIRLPNRPPSDRDSAHFFTTFYYF